MKKLIFLLLFTCLLQAQRKNGYVAFVVGADIKNVVIGSEATQNKPEFNILYKLSMVGDKVEVFAGYEQFKAIGYDKISFGVGYHIKYKKIALIPSIEPCLISREVNGFQTSNLSIGFNTSVRYFVAKNIGIELVFNALPRTDLKQLYPTIHRKIPIVDSVVLCNLFTSMFIYFFVLVQL